MEMIRTDVCGDFPQCLNVIDSENYEADFPCINLSLLNNSTVK
jgi:hypothetical protein